MPPHPQQPPQRASQRKSGRCSRHVSRSLSRSLERTATPQQSPSLQPSAEIGTSPSIVPGRSTSLPSRRSASSSVCPSRVDSTTSEATSDRKKRQKKNEHKKRRTEVTEASHTADQKSHAAAQRLLYRLSEVELQFQLEQDRTQRTTLTPRDVANLVLWSVPAPIPLIESPRIFFIKNKSHVRNVVIIYVNGWSYDELLCTGIGLPRSTDQKKAVRVEAKTKEETPDEGRHRAAVWNSALCRSMLSPVREERCWARPGRGTGCAGGVQYCPLFISSTRNEMAKELWWRNDAPRRPGGGGSTGTSINHSNIMNRNSKPYCGPDHADGDGFALNHVSTPTSAAQGVGSLFHRALQVHSSEKGKDQTTEKAEKEGESGSGTAAAIVASSATAITSSEDFREHQHLWQDAALLAQYALKLPTHATELAELGFTLVPPPPSEAVLHSADEDTQGKEEADEGSRREDELNEDSTAANKEGWAYFDEPVSSLSSSSRVSSGAQQLGGHPFPKVFALDCEMVQVESGESSLARATLVDVQKGEVVLDLLVKPQQRITDYLTRFSGIDKAMLDPVTTTLADCQAQMKRHIDTETFVVGHSLENDFKACKFVPTCYVVDTAWLFPHPAGLPYKNALRFLALKYLGRRIQQGSHDSAVDALVSAELVQLKLLHGPSFGVRPRVSVLGLITSAAGGDGGVQLDAPASPLSLSSPSSPSLPVTSSTLRSEPVLDVQIHLFDDAVTLTSLLPTAQKSSTTPTSTFSPVQPSPQVGRIDAVPARHDEDAMRKAVRALQQRAQQLEAEEKRQTQVEARDGVQAEDVVKPSFGLYWVQLTQTKVDVVLPSSQAMTESPVPCGSASASLEEASLDESPPHEEKEEDSAHELAASSVTKTLTPQQHTAAQHRIVHDTNRRVLRIIEACPEETLVIVLTGRCDGEAGGNHFSRAQGTCFAFIKDSSATGPREDELTRKAEAEVEEMEAQESLRTHDATLGDAAVTAADSEGRTAAASIPVKMHALRDNTPPACQQQ